MPISLSRALAALLLTGATALSACSDPKLPAARSEDQATAQPPQVATGGGETVYHCADGQTLRAAYPTPDTAVIEYGGRTRTLKIGALPGARYVGEGLQWSAKGPGEGVVALLKDGQDMALGPGIDCAVFKRPAATAGP